MQVKQQLPVRGEAVMNEVKSNGFKDYGPGTSVSSFDAHCCAPCIELLHLTVFFDLFLPHWTVLLFGSTWKGILLVCLLSLQQMRLVILFKIKEGREPFTPDSHTEDWASSTWPLEQEKPSPNYGSHKDLIYDKLCFRRNNLQHVHLKSEVLGRTTAA